MRKHRPGAVGLCLLVALCSMALTAASGRAEKNANWMVNGANISATLLPTVKVTEIEKLSGSETRHLVLLSIIGTANVDFLCTEMTFLEAVLKASGSSLGKAKFGGCVTFVKGVESKACRPTGDTGEAGVIVTKQLQDLIVLHKPAIGPTVTLDRIEPEVGSVILTFKTGEECVFGELIELRGTIFAKDCKEELPTEKLTHLFVQGPLTKLFINLDPENVANVDGSVVTELAGAHAGLTWSGLPG